MMTLMYMNMAKLHHLLTTALSLLLAMFLVLGAAQAKAPTEADQTLTQSFVIQGYKMRVPDAYRNPHDRRFYGETTDKIRVHEGSRSGRADFDVLYPLMRAVNDSDRKRGVDNSLPMEIIKLTIEPFPKGHSSADALAMRRMMMNGDCLARKFGDTCPDWIEADRRRNNPVKEAVYLGSNFDFVFCHIFSSSSVLSRCEMRFLLLDHLIIEVRFFRELLSDAILIRHRITQLVCSWIEVPTDRKYFINRCK